MQKPQMDPKDRAFQGAILKKYRDLDVIPSLQQLAQAAGVSIGTAALFMHGNSPSPKLREFVKNRSKKRLKPLPDDLIQLFEIWENLP